MPSLRVGLFATAFYIAVIAIGMVHAYRVDGAPYGTLDMVVHFWWVELILTLITIAVALRYFGWRAVGFGRMNHSQLVWMLPAILILCVMLWALAARIAYGTLTGQDWRILGSLLFTTFLIGFSEEVMFRGILLRAALSRLSPAKAMLLSAIAFSLLHAVNGLGGQSFLNIVQQLGFTFLVGFSLAPLALRIGTLWPLIVWHWLWDFALFAGAHLGVLAPFAFVGICAQVVVCLVLWVRVISAD